jgi:hypothetical protein
VSTIADLTRMAVFRPEALDMTAWSDDQSPQ